MSREYWSWASFWAELFVLSALAVLGAYFAGQGGEAGDYATGITLFAAAIVLAFLRLKWRFDGAAASWPQTVLVDDMRNLVLAIAVFIALALAGLFVAAAADQGSLHIAGLALFLTCGVLVFLTLKNVFDNLDRRP